MPDDDATEPGDRPAIERLLDLAVYAPVGLVCLAHDELPAWVRAGRQRVEQRVTLARFVGKLAVQQGQTELRKRVESRLEQRMAAPERSPQPEEASPLEVVLPPVAQRGPAPARQAPSVGPDELAIADFDSLAAAQVVNRLGGLSAAELDLVEQYEREHRRRRTVLGRIAQLKEAG